MITASSRMLNVLDSFQEWISSSLELVEQMNPIVQVTHFHH